MGVISNKLGTKTWSDSPQNEIQKSSKAQSMSAGGVEQMGGENIGDILNKVVDPNYVDASKKVRSVGNNQMDKDAFMKLMFAQMKNQDPTNPLKSHEMAAQLAQFSGLEQMQNMNTSLTDIKNGQKPSESFQALNFIGKAVEGDSSKLTRVKGDKDHTFSFVLPDSAKGATLRIRNAEGETVRSITMKAMPKGENSFSWNGQDEKGNATPAGEYQFFIDADATNGKKLAVKTDFEGVITGVNYSNEGPVLLVGNQSVKLKDVKKIIDPSLLKNDQKINSVVGQDLKKTDALNQTNSKTDSGKTGEGAPEAKPDPLTQMMNNVGMSRDMINQVTKEVATPAGAQEAVSGT